MTQAHDTTLTNPAQRLKTKNSIQETKSTSTSLPLSTKLLEGVAKQSTLPTTIRTGTNAGKGTLNPPFPRNPLLRLWTGKLPTNELDDLVLATGIKLEPNGCLNEESRKVASHMKISHEAINTIEDEEDIQAQLLFSNAMFAYAELPLCNCRKCHKSWAKTASKESGFPLATTNLHPS